MLGIFKRKQPLVLKVNGKDLDVGGGSKAPRNWDKTIGKFLMAAAALILINALYRNWTL